MNMQAFQYAIFRYVANVVRDEPVNIGVIVRDQSLSDTTAKFLSAAAVSRKAGTKAVALTLALEENLRASDVDPIGSAAILRTPGFFDDARREFHGNLRLSEPRGVMAEDIEQATERVFASHVAEAKSAQPVEVSTKPLSPSYIRSRLWSAFNKVDLFVPGKAAKDYRLRGRHATWTFDVGYKNGGLSLINALAIGTEDAQKNLDRALLFKGMIAEVQDENKEQIHAIAVVPPPLKHPGKNAYAEAQGILADAKIAVFGLQDVDTLVRHAQSQLDLHLAVDR
jgi:hypothetical protein